MSERINESFDYYGVKISLVGYRHRPRGVDMDVLIFRNMHKKRVMISILIMLSFVAIVLSLIFFAAYLKTDLSANIFRLCEKNEEIKISDVTNFDWEIAYIDRNYYGSGEVLKEKYKISGNFKALETDNTSRVAFCKNGELVYDLIVNNEHLEFDKSIEFFYQDAVFTVRWISNIEYDYKKLFLSQKNANMITAEAS